MLFALEELPPDQASDLDCHWYHSRIVFLFGTGQSI